jgi:hypothetical protein
METLILQSSNKSDLRIFTELAHKLGIKQKHLSVEQIEDIGLALAMKKGRTGEYVDTDIFLKKLREKCS